MITKISGVGYRLISYPPPKKISENLSVTPPPEGAVLRPFGPEGCRMKTEKKTQNRNTKPTPNFQNIFSYPNEKIFAKTNTKLSEHFRNLCIRFWFQLSHFIFENQIQNPIQTFSVVGNRLFSSLEKFQEKFQEYIPKKTLKKFYPSVRGI